MRILGISGSLRAASYNTALLRAAAQLTPEGVELDIYDGLELLPPYNEDRDTEDPPAEVARLRAEIAAADAVLFATPEYNTTMPGQIKQVVDWASRPHGPESALWGKPAAAIGASVTDYGAMWAQDHLRNALGIAGARVLRTEFPVARAHDLFSTDGELADPETRDRLAELVESLVEHHSRFAAAA
ncbi:MAG TPA: NADPH-dependent FMN reductase [Solirubrobacteraceae bacterium]|jgi:chromate reductase|nr:NADPH-dependent FMN reductase [Solirubrobacteraceae bacterium]